MVARARESAGLKLPKRIRTIRGPNTEYAARFALADRIAELPSAQVVEDGPHPLPGSISVYLQLDNRPARKRSPAVLFCRVDHTGISVEGLSDSERNHILCRGWGTLEYHRIKLFLPRDDSEVEICWSILYRAHATLINSPLVSPSAPIGSFGEFPETPRTSLF